MGAALPSTGDHGGVTLEDGVSGRISRCLAHLKNIEADVA